MLNESYVQHFTNGTEDKEHKSNGVTDWERAVPLTTSKSASVSFRNTRKTGGDGTTYPVFTTEQVLPNLKAYGGTPIRHEKDELWGRYKPVEYIQSSGTQYIDTGIPAISGVSTEMKGSLATVNTGTGDYLLAARTIRFFAFAAYRNKFNITLVDDNQTTTIGANEVHTVSLQTDGSGSWTSYVDGVFNNSGNDKVTSNANLYMFARKYGDSIDVKTAGKIYYCKIWQGNTLVRDFIPVKDVVNNVYGMYDRVTNTFFGNAGTGAFTGGGEIKQISSISGVTPSTNEMTVRIGTSGYLLNTDTWTLTSVSGTLGSDVLIPQDITVNKGDLKYGVGKNLVNLAQVTDGYYYSTTGVYTPAEVARLTDYIACEPSNSYTISTEVVAAAFAANIRVNYFNGNKEWIRQDYQGFNLGDVEYTVTTPANAKYIRFSANYTGTTYVDWNIMQLEKGSTATPYEPYHFVLYADGSHKVKMDGTEIADISQLLYSANDYVDIQTGKEYHEWTAIWYDGTQTVPSGYISQTGDLTPNQIVLYPLANPTTTDITTTPIALDTKATRTVTSEAEIATTVQSTYRGKE